MKPLHKDNLFCWSAFNEERNLDFHSVFWRRNTAGGSAAVSAGKGAGNVAIDPLPLSAHDRRHIDALGGVQEIVITNSDHVRAAAALKAETGARLWLPEKERATLAHLGGEGLSGGAEPFAGLKVLELRGSKTPGELALSIEDETLVVGDLIRGHRAGRLNLLPDAKLQDKSQALESLRELASLERVEAVLVGDGWPVFSGGHRALQRLLQELLGS
jgi:glyoxylase-like metal-dependent hydrolase (beta-lactamase superfamily II)